MIVFRPKNIKLLVESYLSLSQLLHSSGWSPSLKFVWIKTRLFWEPQRTYTRLPSNLLFVYDKMHEKILLQVRTSKNALSFLQGDQCISRWILRFIKLKRLWIWSYLFGLFPIENLFNLNPAESFACLNKSRNFKDGLYRWTEIAWVSCPFKYSKLSRI